jgi:hypothetical protein
MRGLLVVFALFILSMTGCASALLYGAGMAFPNVPALPRFGGQESSPVPAPIQWQGQNPAPAPISSESPTK